MTNIRFIFLLFFTFLAQVQYTQARELIRLNKNSTDIDPTAKVEIFIDESHQYTIEDVSAPSFTGFRPSQKTRILNEGFSSSTYWVKVDLLYEDKIFTNWLLELGYPSLDHVEYYLLQPGQEKVERIKTGDREVFSSRVIEHPLFLFPLSFNKQGHHTIFLKIRSNGPINIPIRLYQHKSYIERSTTDSIGHGLFFGMLLLLCIYNAFLYLSERDASHLIYTLPVISFTLYYYSLQGHVFQFLLRDYPEASNHVTISILSIWIVTSGWFSYRFLNPKKYAPSTGYILIAVIVLGALTFISTFFVSYRQSVYIIQFSWFTSIALLLGTSVYAWSKGHRYARFFSVAWVFSMAGGVGYVLVISNVVPSNFITDNALVLGQVIQVAFHSIALGDRHNIYKEESKQATQALIAMEKSAKETLEVKVKERTEELALRNEEIEAQAEKLQHINLEVFEKNQELEQQNEEIAAQRDMVEQNSRLIEEKNKKITSSINYALRIQSAILPSEEKRQRLLTESFVFYKPKDIVSGDFYWIEEVGDTIIIAAVDCTGHGVPGAMMSMLGDSSLKQIIQSQEVTEPGAILTLLNQQVINFLHKDSSMRDGMDIAICTWNKTSNTLKYAGAKNPLVYVENNKLYKIKPDKFSIGSAPIDFQYSTNTITTTPDSTFYIFSDGYADQFGGPEGRKLMSRNLQNMLYMIHEKPMDQQVKVVESFHNKWVNSKVPPYSQIDDLLVIGFKTC
ncbi:7TM diverse intracellular signaling domain-containing protein [Algivirga pacifica]|uniref:PPM-type phosphatase domain-containing protein n=1 Tax=Algivirga pacifica TaxID=1162670 RepID=A0ABP9D224_9BACT